MDQILTKEMIQEILENMAIIAEETMVIQETLRTRHIAINPLLKDVLDVIKVFSVIHGEDYPNVVERMIDDDGLITQKHVPSVEEIKNWFDQER